MLTSQKFPTPQPDTKPLSGRALFPFSLFSFFFLLTLPLWGFVWPHPTPPPTPFSFDSNTAVERVQLVVTPKPQSSTASQTSTGTDSYSEGDKSLLEVFSYKPRPPCFVYTCSIFRAVHRRSCFLHNLQSWTNTILTSRSMTMTLKSSALR